MDMDKINEVFDQFRNTNVLVIGDVMIDCYITGKVTRISPEAPVPIVNAQSRTYRLGGAANVALNLKSLGAHPILCSVIGSDNKAKVFYDLMEDCDLDSVGLVPMYGRRTTVKYRIIGNNAHIVHGQGIVPGNTASTVTRSGAIQRGRMRLVLRRCVQNIVVEVEECPWASVALVDDDGGQVSLCPYGAC